MRAFMQNGRNAFMQVPHTFASVSVSVCLCAWLCPCSVCICARVCVRALEQGVQPSRTRGGPSGGAKAQAHHDIITALCDAAIAAPSSDSLWD